MRVRSFFSVKNMGSHGKICLQECFERVSLVTAVREEIPKRMPGACLRKEPYKLSLRGFKSHRASTDVSPVGSVFVLWDSK